MSAEYLVIVHPAGGLDARAATGFWTEVPALAACASEGDSVEDAVASTRREIARWLAGHAQRATDGDAAVRVDVAL